MCPICQKKFTNPSMHALRMHCKMWTCPICPSDTYKQFSAAAINEHFRVDHSDIPIGRTCSICPSTFLGFHGLCNHLKAKHLHDEVRGYSTRIISFRLILNFCRLLLFRP